ncbi:hypothetical protein [Endozoicomonas sp.]|uniref:hypothetical protein n=1 Tax=Endozoicomonas sp. TaxID=1892382 RepID=UPI003AF61F88
MKLFMLLGENNGVLGLRVFIPALIFIFGVSVANTLPISIQLFYFIFSIFVAIFLKLPYSSKEFYGIALLIIYAIVISGGSIELTLKFIRPLIEGFLIAVILYHFKYVKTPDDCYKILFIFLFFQALLSILMFVFPEQRSWLLSLLYNHLTYEGEAFQNALSFRGYGLSQHHLYGLPMAAGLASALCIIGWNYNNTITISLLLLMGFFISLLNGRIGCIPIIFAIIQTCTLSIRISRLKAYFFLGLLAVFFIIIFLILEIRLESAVLIRWWVTGVTQFFNNEPEELTTISDLNLMLHWPESFFGWVFGGGHVCSLDSQCYSDIGFIRLLQQGGLGLLFLLMYLYYLLFVSASRFLAQSKKQFVMILSLFISVFLIATMKGESYASSDFSRMFITISFIGLFLKKRD